MNRGDIIEDIPPEISFPLPSVRCQANDPGSVWRPFCQTEEGAALPPSGVCTGVYSKAYLMYLLIQMKELIDDLHQKQYCLPTWWENEVRKAILKMSKCVKYSLFMKENKTIQTLKGFNNLYFLVGGFVWNSQFHSSWIKAFFLQSFVFLCFYFCLFNDIGLVSELLLTF